MATAKVVPPCERCAALEAWITKALTLFEMIGEEWPKITWLQRQISRATAQCPVTTPGAQEAPDAPTP